MIPASAAMPRWASVGDGLVAGERLLAEEVPIALVYDHATYAVMMATPADLMDFAIGFSLAERMIDSAEDIEALEVIPHGRGIELRIRLAERCADRPRARMRHMAGPVGCGLCGIQSLAEVFQPPSMVAEGVMISGPAIVAALAEMARLQPLNAMVRAAHAAAFWQPERGLVALREDVGRHNALDKLAGALAAEGREGAAGAVVLSSRVSIEMVQKTARLGASIIVAASAPTALAVRFAASCGMTLIGIAREDGFEVFTGPGRIQAVSRSAN